MAPASGSRPPSFFRSRERVFEFFADAFELEKLTPGWLKFSVLTKGPIRITAGTLIGPGSSFTAFRSAGRA